MVAAVTPLWSFDWYEKLPPAGIPVATTVRRSRRASEIFVAQGSPFEPPLTQPISVQVSGPLEPSSLTKVPVAMSQSDEVKAISSVNDWQTSGSPDQMARTENAAGGASVTVSENGAGQ